MKSIEDRRSQPGGQQRDLQGTSIQISSYEHALVETHGVRLRDVHTIQQHMFLRLPCNYGSDALQM